MKGVMDKVIIGMVAIAFSTSIRAESISLADCKAAYKYDLLALLLEQKVNEEYAPEIEKLSDQARSAYLQGMGGGTSFGSGAQLGKQASAPFRARRDKLVNERDSILENIQYARESNKYKVSSCFR